MSDWDSMTSDENWNDGAQHVRVGDPESPVMPGDLNPTNAIPYKAGQFAPSIDALTQDSLHGAKEAGVLPSDLPIYDENGDISNEKLHEWNPEMDLAVAGYEIYNIPKYSSAILLSALKNMGRLPVNAGLSAIRNVPRDDTNKFGYTIIAAKYSFAGRKFRGELEIYPDFFRYIHTPLLPKVEGKASGISVATYSVFHAVGHLLFAKLSADGQVSQLGDVLGKDVWSKKGSGGWASYLGTPTSRTWKRANHATPVSQLAKASPSDDFAETFALRFNNPDYLETAFPEKFRAMTNIIMSNMGI